MQKRVWSLARQGVGRVIPFYLFLVIFSGCASQLDFDAKTLPTSTNAGETAAAIKKSPLGVNIGGFTYYDVEVAFTDVFKQAGPWLGQTSLDYNIWDQGGLHKDAFDNILYLDPYQIAAKLLFKDLGEPDASGAYRFPSGNYTFIFEGEGKFEFVLGATQLSLAKDGNTTTIDLLVDNKQNGVLVKMVEINPTNPIRNIRMYLPGYEADQAPTFNPDFISLIEPFNTIRFLDWQHTNNSTLVSWNERRTLDHVTQTGEDGLAYEYMIELCNQVESNIWINIPHLADKDFIHNLAQLLKEQVDEDLVIYVEYSNEVWNEIFDQAKYAEQQGNALYGETDPLVARAKYYAAKSSEVFKIFEEVFAGEMHRIRRTVAAFSATSWVAENILKFGDVAQHADALAIAPYFGASFGFSENLATAQAMSVDELVEAAALEIESEVLPDLVDHRKLADDYGLSLIAYEAGQHLVGAGPVKDIPEMTEKFIAANKHPDMEQIYRDYVDVWKQAGGELMVLFRLMERPTQYGSFGLRYGTYPVVSSDVIPKWDAVESMHELDRWFDF